MKSVTMIPPDAERRSILRGVLYGLTAALAWAIYNAGAKLGIAQGFHAVDLTVLRFAVSGLAMLPVAILCGLPPIGVWRNLLLAMSAGPLFAVLVNEGFALAPLAHGVVFGPGAALLSTILLARILDGERPAMQQLAGSAMLGLGLVVVALDGWTAGSGHAVAFGDLAFVAAGTFWGTFTTLLKRWNVNAVQAAAGVATLSAAVFVPLYVVFGGRLAFDAGSIAMQGLYQGVLGGCVGVLAYAAAVTELGAGKAALFPAAVPALAIVLAVPMLHETPTGLELVGIAVCTIGLVTALGLFAPLGRRFA